jgi:tRNA-dihydrouridine synthase B
MTSRKKDAISEMVKAKAVLAPMSGITDIPFRLMARKFGCRFTFTEMIDINGLIYNNQKTYGLMDTVPEDAPIGVQLVGEDADKFAKVAEICEEKGFSVLDINAGCPARKVIKCGKGSALMKDPEKLAGIIGKLVKIVSIPVTVKIRSGWDERNLNYIEVAKAAAAAGASAVGIHTRTRDAMYRGSADHSITERLKKALDVPVFASGNIFSSEDAFKVMDETGCDGVFVARGALGRPWIFKEIAASGRGKNTVISYGLDKIKDIMLEHYALYLKYSNELIAKRRMYKHVTWYLKKYKNLNEVMKVYLKADGPESFKNFIKNLSVDERNRIVL